jgi:hypothetical protein
MYYFPRERPVTIRCPKGASCTTHTEQLLGGGLIHGATACAITTNELRTLPDVYRLDYAYLDTPVIYVPDLAPILAAHETPNIEEIVPATRDHCMTTHS